MGKLLVTGALGQIGTELSVVLAERYGLERVIASDIKDKVSDSIPDEISYYRLDVLDFDALRKIVKENNVEIIFHMAALLSAVAESNPQKAWKVNVDGLYNVLEVAREFGCGVFFPSSIGAFGPSTPKNKTPQVTIQRPTTVYGISKLAGELLCDYYFRKYGIDTRGLRFPGLISYKTLPGGGTTDYAVEIFYEAVKKGKYTCYLSRDTRLDMMYMPDAITAIIKLMEADGSKLKNRNAYNVTSMSVTPEEIAASIRRFMPNFEIEYEVDVVRQSIADSWPDSLDDSCARAEWGWQPEYSLERMTKDMLEKVSLKLKKMEEK